MNSYAAKYISSLSLVFLLSSCASKPPPVETLGVLDVDKNCNDVLRVTRTQGEDVSVRDFKMGRNEGCEGFRAFATLVNLEMNDPAMDAIKSAAALDLVTTRSTTIEDAILKALSEYDISEQDLKERVEFEDAIGHIKKIPGSQCTSDFGVRFKGIDFCEAPEENPGAPKKYNPLKDGMHLGEVPTAE